MNTTTRAAASGAQPVLAVHNSANALLAIDQNCATVVYRILRGSRGMTGVARGG